MKIIRCFIFWQSESYYSGEIIRQRQLGPMTHWTTGRRHLKTIFQHFSTCLFSPSNLVIYFFPEIIALNQKVPSRVRSLLIFHAVLRKEAKRARRRYSDSQVRRKVTGQSNRIKLWGSAQQERRYFKELAHL